MKLKRYYTVMDGELSLGEDLIFSDSSDRLN